MLYSVFYLFYVMFCDLMYATMILLFKMYCFTWKNTVHTWDTWIMALLHHFI